MHTREGGFKSLAGIAAKYQGAPEPALPSAPPPPPPPGPVLTVLDGDGEPSGPAAGKGRRKIAFKPRNRRGGCNRTGRTGHRILGPQSGGLDALQFIRPDGVEKRALTWMIGRRVLGDCISERTLSSAVGISKKVALKVITLWATPNGDTPAWFDANFRALIVSQIECI